MFKIEMDRHTKLLIAMAVLLSLIIYIGVSQSVFSVSDGNDDTTRPNVIGSYPSDGIIGVERNIVPYIEFDEVLSPDTTTGDFFQIRYYHSDDSSGAVPVDIVWNSSYNRVEFHLIEDLEYGTQYYFYVSQYVEDMFGNYVAEYWDSTNKSEHEFTTEIAPDTEAPVITVDPLIYELLVGDEYDALFGVIAMDNYDGNITQDIIIGGDTVVTDATGTFFVTFDVTDNAGNIAEQIERTVVVRNVPDTDIPVITLNGDSSVTLEAVQDSYTELGAICTDDIDGTSSAEIGGDTVMTSEPGIYVVTYNCTDDAGNQAEEVIRSVIVEDTTPPTITLNGSSEVRLKVGETYNDAGAVWFDMVDGTGDAQIISNTVDTGKQGTYEVKYRVVDSSGNETIVSRTVIVEAEDEVTTGSVTVCNSILNDDGYISDGVEKTNTKFVLKLKKGKKKIKTFQFTTPMTMNSDVIENESGIDAECQTIPDLKFGQYQYKKAVIRNGKNEWLKTLYNDEWDSEVEDITDYERFGTSDNSNGIINVSKSRPNRTILLLNTMKKKMAVNGSVTVCKIIVDKYGNVMDGSELNDNASFDISLRRHFWRIHKFKFDLPLTLNTKILDSSEGFDAQCEVYEGLKFGSYRYGREDIDHSDLRWKKPMYNDMFKHQVHGLGGFYTYKYKKGEKNSDGHITISASKPNATLVILNRLEDYVDGGGDDDDGDRHKNKKGKGHSKDNGKGHDKDDKKDDDD